ncbi:MAG TPA: hypothetical protein VEK11_05190 [Thermoanaerobaculia bacterium]|jgi:hypothetical protein|nr:hypothetical protein [Thermoanaerobaculia bacterium]
MPLLLRAILAGVFLCLAASADANIMFKDTTDHGCADDMSTDDCFGPTTTGSSGPIILTCRAFGSAGQYCRACRERYFDNGQYAGYKVCAYVKESAYCKCQYPGTDSCHNEGSCTYY